MSKKDPPPFLLPMSSTVKELGADPKTGISGKESVAPGDPTLSELKRSRGYQKRSFNMHVKTCENYFKEFTEQTSNNSLKYLLMQAYAKAKNSFHKYEQLNSQVVKLTPDDKVEAEMIEFETLYQIFTELGTMVARSAQDLGLDLSTVEEEKPEPDLLKPGEGEPTQKTQASTRFLPLTKDDTEPIEKEAKWLIQAMNSSYQMSSHVQTFEGDELQYVSFRYSFEAAERLLRRMGTSPFERFIQLKKVLKGQPLKMVENLPAVDSSYEVALELLDSYYLNPMRNMTIILKKLSDLPTMGKTLESIKTFYTNVLSIVNSLKAQTIGPEDPLGAGLLLSNIVAKLNPPALREWTVRCSRKKSLENPLGHECGVDELLQVILLQQQIAESYSHLQNQAAASKPVQKEAKPYWGGKKSYPTLPKAFWAQSQQKNDIESSHETELNKAMALVSVNNTGAKRKPNCNICTKAPHYPLHCPDIKNKTPEELFSLANKNRLCKLCLATSHKTKDCKLKNKFLCIKCKQPHHVRLHLGQLVTGEEPVFKVNLVMTAIQGFDFGPSPIPHVLRAKASRPGSQHYKIIDLLFDSGANLCLVTEKLARELQLPEIANPSSKTVEVLGGKSVTLKPGKVQLELTSITNDYKCILAAAKIDHIAVEESKLNFQKDDYDHLKNYNFTIPLPKLEPSYISLLVGEPVFSALITGLGPRCSNLNCEDANCCPVVIQSKLGNYLAGGYMTPTHFSEEGARGKLEP